jgi:CBS domain-containing protein
MRISTLMETPVLKINGDSTVREAAEMMGKNRIGALLVTKGDEDVGIITERDIMSKIIAEKRDLAKVKVNEITSKPIITIDKDTDAEKVIEIMAEKGIRRILVTDKEEIVGIFSTSDITKLPAMSQ